MARRGDEAVTRAATGRANAVRCTAQAIEPKRAADIFEVFLLPNAIFGFIKKKKKKDKNVDNRNNGTRN